VSTTSALAELLEIQEGLADLAGKVAELRLGKRVGEHVDSAWREVGYALTAAHEKALRDPSAPLYQPRMPAPILGVG
jgi:hypothetical protein